MPAPFFIVGPTGVGKSDLAAEAAALAGAEIVGADAFQVYAGLDILTAKPSAEVRARVPHHLIGTVPLAEEWNAARFEVAARACLEDIAARGRMAFVVGGTGLYVKALTHGLAHLPPTPPALREELSMMDLAELTRLLVSADPQAGMSIDLNNKRRVVRAMEILRLTGRPLSETRAQWRAPRPGVRGIFLFRDRDALYRRIDERVRKMFREGVLDEVRAIGEVGPTARQTLGLREVQACLRGEISVSECIERLKTATRRYAKRQLTWFKRETILQPLNLSEVRSAELVVCRIAQGAKVGSAPRHD